MNKEITNNELARKMDKMGSDLNERIDDVLFCVKQGFDDITSRFDKNDTEHLLMKHELARVGDTCARIEIKLDQENAAHQLRFERLENHCGI